MVVITIVTTKNGQTVNFEEPISKAKYIRLPSCSLYNSWDNIKLDLIFEILHEKNRSVVDRKRIVAGYYTQKRFAEELKEILKEFPDIKVITDINSPTWRFNIKDEKNILKVYQDRFLDFIMGKKIITKENIFLTILGYKKHILFIAI